MDNMCSLIISILNIYLFLFMHSIESQRRTMNGKAVNKTYVVYFIHDKAFDYPYNWACGGAIIHPRYILTHDICAEYQSNLWVVPGYNKLVNHEDMTTDACTSKFRIKVSNVCRYAKSCEPGLTSILTKYYNISLWSNQTIAICELEKRIDYSDASYLKYCSYKPTQIRLTYREQSYAPGVDAVVYGWGSNKYHRPNNSDAFLNSQYLMGTSVKIMDTNECRNTYQRSYPNQIVFRKEIICSHGVGNVDVLGNYMRSARRNNSNANETDKYNNMSENKIFIPSRRTNGPCQSDQGSPLVTWMGGIEYVIGVVATYFVDENMECLGPYQYLSVALSSNFINCSLSYRSRRNNPNCDDFDLPNSTFDADDIDWEAELESLDFHNGTELQPQDYWLYSDEK